MVIFLDDVGKAKYCSIQKREKSAVARAAFRRRQWFQIPRHSTLTDLAWRLNFEATRGYHSNF